MNRSDKITLDQMKNTCSYQCRSYSFCCRCKVSAATDNPFLMAVVSQDMLEVDY